MGEGNLSRKNQLSSGQKSSEIYRSFSDLRAAFHQKTLATLNKQVAQNELQASNRLSLERLAEAYQQTPKQRHRETIKKPWDFLKSSAKLLAKRDIVSDQEIADIVTEVANQWLDNNGLKGQCRKEVAYEKQEAISNGFKKELERSQNDKYKSSLIRLILALDHKLASPTITLDLFNSKRDKGLVEFTEKIREHNLISLPSLIELITKSIKGKQKIKASRVYENLLSISDQKSQEDKIKSCRNILESSAKVISREIECFQISAKQLIDADDDSNETEGSTTTELDKEKITSLVNNIELSTKRIKQLYDLYAFALESLGDLNPKACQTKDFTRGVDFLNFDNELGFQLDCNTIVMDLIGKGFNGPDKHLDLAQVFWEIFSNNTALDIQAITMRLRAKFMPLFSESEQLRYPSIRSNFSMLHEINSSSAEKLVQKLFKKVSPRRLGAYFFRDMIYNFGSKDFMQDTLVHQILNARECTDDEASPPAPLFSELIEAAIKDLKEKSKDSQAIVALRKLIARDDIELQDLYQTHATCKKQKKDWGYKISDQSLLELLASHIDLNKASRELNEWIDLVIKLQKDSTHRINNLGARSRAIIAHAKKQAERH